jgi:AcrR family transcriptional regulator
MEKKQAILKTAAQLFANQGFDGTTTVQIAREAGVTEPLIFYHFKGKDELFTRIIESMFVEYFSRLDLLEQNPESPFKQIQKLIELQFDIVEEFPDEVYIISSTPPVRFADTANIFAGNIKAYRRRLSSFLTGCISAGIKAGEFIPVQMEATANLLTAMLNGIVRFRFTRSDQGDNLRQTTIDFCRRSLMNGSSGQKVIKHNR